MGAGKTRAAIFRYQYVAALCTCICIHRKTRKCAWAADVVLITCAGLNQRKAGGGGRLCLSSNRYTRPNPPCANPELTQHRHTLAQSTVDSTRCIQKWRTRLFYKIIFFST